MEVLGLAHYTLGNLDTLWTLFLLMVRFTAVIMVLPGIGGGARGLPVRMPAIIVLAAASCSTSNRAVIPGDWVLCVAQLVSEVTLGLCFALIPLLIIAGVQLAGNLASTSMGLQPSQLIDPTSQVPLPDISRIWSDLATILFLMLSGHHVIVYAAAGLGGEITPGTFIVGQNSWAVLSAQTTVMWKLGATVAAPVIVALLFANFVMGLISKAVPTVNIFIVSFPLLIGIGLALSVLMLPDLMVVMDQRVRSIEGAILTIASDAS